MQCGLWTPDQRRTIPLRSMLRRIRGTIHHTVKYFALSASRSARKAASEPW
jgi:hypothetical protein